MDFYGKEIAMGFWKKFWNLYLFCLMVPLFILFSIYFIATDEIIQDE